MILFYLLHAESENFLINTPPAGLYVINFYHETKLFKSENKKSDFIKKNGKQYFSLLTVLKKV